MKALFAAMAIATLGACSGPQPSSYVGKFESDHAAPKIAYDIAGFVSLHAKPKSGPISVEVASGDGTVGPELLRDLESIGFTISSVSPSHKLKYQVTEIGNDLLVRIFLDRWDAARIYSTDDGIVAQGPFAERAGS